MENEKFERHIDKPSKMILKDSQGKLTEFEIKPLGYEYIKDILVISRLFTKGPEWLNYAKEEDFEIMKKLVNATIDVSFPELPEKTKKEFAKSNFLPILLKCLEINNLGSSKMALIEEKIRRIRYAKVKGNQKKVEGE